MGKILGDAKKRDFLEQLVGWAMIKSLFCMTVWRRGRRFQNSKRKERLPPWFAPWAVDLKTPKILENGSVFVENEHRKV